MYKKIISFVCITLWAATALAQKDITVTRAEKNTDITSYPQIYPINIEYEIVFNIKDDSIINEIGNISFTINKVIIDNKIYTINKYYPKCDYTHSSVKDSCTQFIKFKTYLPYPHSKKNYLDLKNSKYQNFYKTKMGNAEALIIGTQNNKKFYLKILKINKHEHKFKFPSFPNNKKLTLRINTDTVK